MKKLFIFLILIVSLSAFALPVDSLTNYVAGYLTNNNVWSGTNSFTQINGAGTVSNSQSVVGSQAATIASALQTIPIVATNSFAAKAGTNLLDNGTGNLTPNGTNAVVAQITSPNISAVGGATNGGIGYTLGGNFTGNHSGIYRGGNPVRVFAFADSLFQNLLINGFKSQGGFTNQYASGSYTNGYLYYNVGTYAANNISIVDILTNILALQRGVILQVDLAGAVPGQRGGDIYGGYTSLQAAQNFDQTHGFTYNSVGTNSAVVHGDPNPLTFWPDSTNDVKFTVQGLSYTNIDNSPISFTVTGTSYVPIYFYGTPSYITVARITRPYKPGEGSNTKYAPPYTSACDGFNFSGGNIPVSVWALSNAPSTTKIPAGAIVSWGNNDINGSIGVTNPAAIWNNQANFANYLHTLGFYPVILVGASGNPNIVGAAGLAMTNFFNYQRTNWVGVFDYYYDLEKTNELMGQIKQSTNYIDGTHWTTLFAGQNATNMNLALGWDTLMPNPLAAGVSPNDGISVTNISPVTGIAAGTLPANVLAAALTTFTTNFTTALLGSNVWSRPIELFPNIIYGEASVAGVSSLQCEVLGTTTNYAVPMVTIIGSVAQTLKGSVMPIIVPVNGTWYFRDTSSGIGNSCSPTNGQIQIQ